MTRKLYLIDPSLYDQKVHQQYPYYSANTIIKKLNGSSPLQDNEPKGFACVTMSNNVLAGVDALIRTLWAKGTSMDWGHEGWMAKNMQKVLFEAPGWSPQPEMAALFEVNTSKAKDKANVNPSNGWQTILDDRRTNVLQLDEDYAPFMHSVLSWIISGVPEDAKKAVPDFNTVVWTGSINVGTCNVIPHMDESDADGPGFHKNNTLITLTLITLITLRTHNPNNQPNPNNPNNQPSPNNPNNPINT